MRYRQSINETILVIGRTADTAKTFSIGANEELITDFSNVTTSTVLGQTNYPFGYYRLYTLPVSVSASYGTNIRFIITFTGATDYLRVYGYTIDYMVRRMVRQTA